VKTQHICGGRGAGKLRRDESEKRREYRGNLLHETLQPNNGDDVTPSARG
jgi:hypothetical protein